MPFGMRCFRGHFHPFAYSVSGWRAFSSADFLAVTGKENFGFTHAEGSAVVLQGIGNIRKTVIHRHAAPHHNLCPDARAGEVLVQR
jgi:hypothetical protein